MTGRVFRLHSTLELPLEDVETYFEEDPDLPPEIEDIDITRRNNTLIIKALSDDESISKYTPTAQLKASVTETRVWEEEPPRAGGSRATARPSSRTPRSSTPCSSCSANWRSSPRRGR